MYGRYVGSNKESLYMYILGDLSTVSQMIVILLYVLCVSFFFSWWPDFARWIGS